MIAISLKVIAHTANDAVYAYGHFLHIVWALYVESSKRYFAINQNGFVSTQ